MPTREDVLREQTFKTEVDDLDTRVFYTLFFKAGGKDELPESIKNHRTSKLLAGLVAKMSDKKLLDEEEIDELLFNLI